MTPPFAGRHAEGKDSHWQEGGRRKADGCRQDGLRARNRRAEGHSQEGVRGRPTGSAGSRGGREDVNTYRDSSKLFGDLGENAHPTGR